MNRIVKFFQLVKLIGPSLLLLLLCGTVLAQPRVGEDRMLARAVHEARELVTQHHYPLAINTLEAALDSADAGQDRSDALYLLAHANFMAGRYLATLVTSRELLFRYPGDERTPEVLYMRGVAGYQEGRKEESEGAFRQALASAVPRR